MRKARQEVFTGEQKEGSSSGWGLAIAETDRQIKDAEQRIAELKLSRATFEQMLKRGETFIPESEVSKEIVA